MFTKIEKKVSLDPVFLRFLEAIQADLNDPLLEICSAAEFSITPEQLLLALGQLPKEPLSLFHRKLLQISHLKDIDCKLKSLKELQLTEQVTLLKKIESAGIVVELDFSLDELLVLFHHPFIEEIDFILPYVLTEKNMQKFFSKKLPDLFEFKQWVRWSSCHLRLQSKQKLDWIIQNASTPTPLSFFADVRANSKTPDVLSVLKEHSGIALKPEYSQDCRRLWEVVSEEHNCQFIASGAEAAVRAIHRFPFVVRRAVWGRDIEKKQKILSNIVHIKKLMKNIGNAFETGIIDILSYKIFDHHIDTLMPRCLWILAMKA